MNAPHAGGKINWFTLLRPFIEIGLLRKSPQILPGSSFLMGLTLAAFLVVNTIAYGMRYELNVVAAASLLEISVLLCFVASLLLVYGKPERIVQTISALTGCSAILGVLLLPLQLWLVRAELSDQLGPQHVLVALPFLVWEVLIRAHILRHALDRGLAFGVLVSIGYFWVMLELVGRLLHGMGALGEG